MPTIPVLVTFDRIGRNHAVPPLPATIDLDASLAKSADKLAGQVFTYARRHLASRDVDVEVGLNPPVGGLLAATFAANTKIGGGHILCGFNSGGRFEVTVAPTQEGPPA